MTRDIDSKTNEWMKRWDAQVKPKKMKQLRQTGEEEEKQAAEKKEKKKDCQLSECIIYDICCKTAVITFWLMWNRVCIQFSAVVSFSVFVGLR